MNHGSSGELGVLMVFTAHTITAMDKQAFLEELQKLVQQEHEAQQIVLKALQDLLASVFSVRRLLATKDRSTVVATHIALILRAQEEAKTMASTTQDSNIYDTYDIPHTNGVPRAVGQTKEEESF